MDRCAASDYNIKCKVKDNKNKGFLIKLKIEVPYDPTIPLLSIYQRKT